MTQVIDGDTVEMEELGRVRLIGVNTPEDGRCYETAATRFTRERLEGKTVNYELGEEREDRYGRTLAYLSRGGEMHNRLLLSKGFAKLLTIPPNDKYAQDFEAAERRAQRTDAGLWDTCDRNNIRARRGTARREGKQDEARRLAVLAKQRARRARRAARALARQEARRVRAAARARAREAEEEFATPPPESTPEADGGLGGSCLPSSACPGKRDGDGDGCYCEG